MLANPLVEISIVPFRYKYLPMLLEMLKDQKYMGITEVTMETLPKIGYVALMNNKPVAAGFLRRVEGKYAQLDGLTSNPYFGSQIRHKAIDSVVKNLLLAGKSLKLKGIIAFTSDKGVIMRAEDMGFHIVKDQTILGLRL